MKIDCVKPYSGSVYTLLVACVFAALTCAAATTDAEPVSAERQHTWWAGPGYWDRRHAAKLKEIASGPKEYDFVFLGTNNGESAEEIAEGIKAVVRKILEKQPEAKVVLMPIFPAEHSPSAPRRIRNARASELAKSVADGKRVIWLDFNSVFLEKDGTLSPEMMPDYLHPLEHGYRLWRAAIEPVMRKVIAGDLKNNELNKEVKR